MQTPPYDIFRRNPLGKALCIEEAADLEAAKVRILHLAERFPAEYVVLHRATSTIVANFCFRPNEIPSLTCVGVDPESEH